MEQGPGRLGHCFPGQQGEHVGLRLSRLCRHRLTRHPPLCKLAAGQFPMTDDGHAIVPVVPLDTAQAFIGGTPLPLDTLDEIEPVEQDQAGNSGPLVIALRNGHDRQKIVLVEPGPGGADIDEGGYSLVGHG